MLPSRHIIVSVPLGAAAGFFTESLSAGLLCFLSGILIDVDHIIEYIIHHRPKSFNFKEFYQACGKFAKREEEGGVKKLYLIFHAGEFAILLWMIFAFFRNIYLFSIALGYTGHIISDALVNTLKPSTYFITMRIKNNFDVMKFVKDY